MVQKSIKVLPGRHFTHPTLLPSSISYHNMKVPSSPGYGSFPTHHHHHHPSHFPLLVDVHRRKQPIKTKITTNKIKKNRPVLLELDNLWVSSTSPEQDPIRLTQDLEEEEVVVVTEGKEEEELGGMNRKIHQTIRDNNIHIHHDEKHQEELKSILKKSSSWVERKDPKSSSSSSSSSTHVQFHEARIRIYPVVLGDHPCCSSGPPLSLDWIYCSEHTLSLDEYEQNRLPKKKGRKYLRMDQATRRQILLEGGGGGGYTNNNDGSRDNSNGTITSSSSSSSPYCWNQYTKHEIRAAERRLSRERVRMRKRYIVEQFFSASPLPMMTELE